MTNKTEPQSKEFTLPFVGREEELKFLLDEYDQMLHAQYRSVWIEAPAGMGKTTLVEEFLRRISNLPGFKNLADLRPWIIHAHLRERSSNSLASFVEALGVTLQTLTKQQQEKLFSGLTSFWQERAMKIVGGGNVQSMDMDEAITTAGYILKQLSKYFPLIVIIEDIHVLKGEMSFYALRYLQAIAEHVPMLMLYISRPSDEKNLIQFREQTIKEGCSKYEVDSLKYEDVQNLVETHRVRLDVDIKKLMHLSGGNALLLRELLKSDVVDDVKGGGSTTDRIIRYLLKDLERLPKRDRELIAIAGMLGEEFSEQLLREITRSKHFIGWSDDALTRLKKKGIIIRRKKVLKPEGEGKEVSLEISVFTHALWWEAARRLYEKEKIWTDKKFAETIVPLLSNEDYPLLTDAGLLVKLLQLSSNERMPMLLRYVNDLCGYGARWHFHSPQENKALLTQSKKCIIDLMKNKRMLKDKQLSYDSASLLNMKFVINASWDDTIEERIDDNALVKQLLSGFLNDDHAVMGSITAIMSEINVHYFIHPTKSCIETARLSLTSLLKKVRGNSEAERCISLLLRALEGFEEWFRKPVRAQQSFYSAAASFDVGVPVGVPMEKSLEILFLYYMSVIPSSVQIVKKNFALLENILSKLKSSKEESFQVRLAEIRMCFRRGDIERAYKRIKELEKVYGNTWLFIEKFQIKLNLAMIEIQRGNIDEALTMVDEMFSDDYSSINYTHRLILFGKGLLYAEETDRLNVYWERCKTELLENNKTLLLSLLEARIVLCLLCNNDQESEALEMLKKFARRYPLVKNAVESSLNKMLVFLALKRNHSAATRGFDKFILHDEYLAPFDKAYYAYLFARIGVKYGHDPKEFSNYVKYSLDGLIKLGLPKRIVFTAEKFAEVNLISQKELQHIKKRYKLPDSRPEKIQSTTDIIKTSNIERGITFRCFGRLRALDPFGNEIIGRTWGKQKPPTSRHKRVVMELIRAKLEHRSVSRMELLSSLHPEIDRGNVSEKKMYSLSRRLSVLLPELKQAFSPYDIFQKTENGYELHSSVRIDLLEAKDEITRGKQLAQIHLPSAVWLMRKALTTLTQEEFAEGFHGTGLKTIRQECQELSKEGAILLKRNMEKMAL